MVAVAVLVRGQFHGLIGLFVGPTIVGIQELPKTLPLDMLVRPCYNYGYFRVGFSPACPSQRGEDFVRLVRS